MPPDQCLQLRSLPHIGQTYCIARPIGQGMLKRGVEIIRAVQMTIVLVTGLVQPLCTAHQNLSADGRFRTDTGP
ncbi:hypothetical protein D3C76_1425300 [compost metagenome]